MLASNLGPPLVDQTPPTSCLPYSPHLLSPVLSPVSPPTSYFFNSREASRNVSMWPLRRAADLLLSPGGTWASCSPSSGPQWFHL